MPIHIYASAPLYIHQLPLPALFMILIMSIIATSAIIMTVQPTINTKIGPGNDDADVN